MKKKESFRLDGEKVRDLRKQKNLSRTALAKQAALSLDQINDIERGRRGSNKGRETRVHSSTLYALAKTLGVSPSFIIKRDDATKMRVLVWNAEQDDNKCTSIGDWDLPLRIGDSVRIEVKLDEPAFIYVVWINSCRAPHLLYPGDRSCTEAPLRIKAICLPEDGGFPIEEPAGVEAILLIAVEHWIEKQAILTTLEGFPVPKPHRATDLVDFQCSEAYLRSKKRAAIGTAPVPLTQPKELARNFLRANFAERALFIEGFSCCSRS